MCRLEYSGIGSVIHNPPISSIFQRSNQCLHFYHRHRSCRMIWWIDLREIWLIRVWSVGCIISQEPKISKNLGQQGNRYMTSLIVWKDVAHLMYVFCHDVDIFTRHVSVENITCICVYTYFDTYNSIHHVGVENLIMPLTDTVDVALCTQFLKANEPGVPWRCE